MSLDAIIEHRMSCKLLSNLNMDDYQRIQTQAGISLSNLKRSKSYDFQTLV